MATSIQSTALDFTSIKENLKLHLAGKPEFADYNFEASGLSNILDVLAYNTHYNGLIANFATNESYLGTAQLRSSMVSLATALGYIPKSVTSAEAVLNISLDLSSVSERPNLLSIPAGKLFNSTIDESVYTFRTTESIVAYDNGEGLYNFTNLSDSSDIIIYEGIEKTKRFTVAPYSDDTVYVIPDENFNMDSMVVKVYESLSSTSYVEYENILTATEITDESRYYYVKEAPNGFYEMTFGNGSTMGVIPTTGQIIEVTYLSPAGSIANGGKIFSAVSPFTLNSESYDLTIVTVEPSSGGTEKESIESIRKNAPFQFASQNRMVTADDYTSVIYRNFSTYIKDIKAYGGQDADEPKFGVIYISIVFNADVAEESISLIKTQITELVEKLAIASFEIEFIDAKEVYIETSTFFQYNPAKTNFSASRLEGDIELVVSNYFEENLGNFDQSFRRSNLLTDIDESNSAILSSRIETKMQQRFEPTLNAANEVVFTFPQELAVADDVFNVVTSSYFVNSGRTCLVKNKLGSTKLQVVSGTDVIVDNVGYFDPDAKTVNINGLIPESIVGDVEYLKVSVTPANQSAISPSINTVLLYDSENSTANPVVTSAEN